ncbi:hypothetical protein NIES2100_05610 [Calothrix sp. NIES-2100]|uniref:hypothetical protein n=1 Tax=Calothrix sp. NIES-2100 TaxID=1954172 RepID=UPI000B5E71A4|nr:hypothetical protein NIES2100_05610 [Calothrix sp. NIES-2100]
MIQHPFSWHVIKTHRSNEQAYQCFSRLRGHDSSLFFGTDEATKENAIAHRDYLNRIEKWDKYYTTETVQRVSLEYDVYPEEFLNGLEIVG